MPSISDTRCTTRKIKNFAFSLALSSHPSIADAKTLAKSFEKVGSTLVPTETNLVDIVWGDGRPPTPKNQVFVLEEKYAGRNIDFLLVISR